MTIQSMFSHPHRELSASTLERTTVGFSAAAAIAIVFNALLTIVKDYYQPLNDVMAKLTGHHWITHGVVVLIVFVVLGWVLTTSEAVRRMSDTALIASVFVASVVGGGAIALWFMFV